MLITSVEGLDKVVASKVMRKADIKELIHTIEALKKEEESRTEDDNNNSNNGGYIPLTSTLAPGKDCSTEPVILGTGSHDSSTLHTDNNPSPPHLDTDLRHNNRRKRDISQTKNIKTSNFDSSFHRSDDHKVDTPFMDILRRIMNKETVGGKVRQPRAVTESTTDSVYDDILPYVLPQSIGMKSTVAKDDGEFFYSRD